MFRRHGADNSTDRSTTNEFNLAKGGVCDHGFCDSGSIISRALDLVHHSSRETCLFENFKNELMGPGAEF